MQTSSRLVELLEEGIRILGETKIPESQKTMIREELEKAKGLQGELDDVRKAKEQNVKLYSRAIREQEDHKGALLKELDQSAQGKSSLDAMISLGVKEEELNRLIEIYSRAIDAADKKIEALESGIQKALESIRWVSDRKESQENLMKAHWEIGEDGRVPPPKPLFGGRYID
jgi:hypothetical protein